MASEARNTVVPFKTVQNRTSFGGHRRRLQNVIKTYLWKIKWDGVDWTRLALYGDGLQAWKFTYRLNKMLGIF